MSWIMGLLQCSNEEADRGSRREPQAFETSARSLSKLEAAATEEHRANQYADWGTPYSVRMVWRMGEVTFSSPIAVLIITEYSDPAGQSAPQSCVIKCIPSRAPV